jgi:hypothetical protein
MPHIVEWKLVIELGKNVIGMSYFIPQKVYQPYTEADRLRYIQEITLKKTIFFYSQSELGILLDDALKQRLKHLDDKDEPMFVGCGPSVSIRLQACSGSLVQIHQPVTHIYSGQATVLGRSKFQRWTLRILRVLSRN